MTPTAERPAPPTLADCGLLTGQGLGSDLRVLGPPLDRCRTARRDQKRTAKGIDEPVWAMGVLSWGIMFIHVHINIHMGSQHRISAWTFTADVLT